MLALVGEKKLPGWGNLVQGSGGARPLSVMVLGAVLPSGVPWSL